MELKIYHTYLVKWGLRLCKMWERMVWKQKDIIHQVEVVDAERVMNIFLIIQSVISVTAIANLKRNGKKIFLHHVIFKMQKQGTLKLEYGKIKEAMSTYPEINLQTVRQAIISIRKTNCQTPIM